jgi:hypothetical protein
MFEPPLVIAFEPLLLLHLSRTHFIMEPGAILDLRALGVKGAFRNYDDRDLSPMPFVLIRRATFEEWVKSTLYRTRTDPPPYLGADRAGYKYWEVRTD